ncbi:transcription initiation factor IIA, gamma subunit [Hymenopellis radicata]|nr:transcription initiation factor IIA, gamma subunit [Hymenopellis radicata]
MSKNSTPSYHEVYRASALGSALTDSLDELIMEGKMSPELGRRIAAQFDESYTKVVQKEVRKKISMKGKLHRYNLCEDVWVFHVRQIEFKGAETKRDNKVTVNCPKLKIVACRNDVQ